MTKTVTIDTNLFQHFIRPHRFPNDKDPKSLQIVHDALKANLLRGFVADPIAHIEQIPKAKRSAYFAGVRTQIQGSEQLLPDGTLKASYKISPDPSGWVMRHHPSDPQSNHTARASHACQIRQHNLDVKIHNTDQAPTTTGSSAIMRIPGRFRQ
jgi:hypothetical protein